MLHRICLLITLVLLTACTYPEDLNDPPVDLGNFRLEHNIVVAPLAETSTAISRSVSEEQLTTALRDAIAARFDRYEGSKRYHLGVSIEGYILARAGVPVVAAPKSAMIIRVTVWDDAQAKKLNVPPEQMTILENIDGESLIGTGWTQSAEKQLEGLARNAAKSIENYLVRQNEAEGWFKDDGTQNDGRAEETDAGLLRDVQSGTAQTES